MTSFLHMTAFGSFICTPKENKFLFIKRACGFYYMKLWKNFLVQYKF